MPRHPTLSFGFRQLSITNYGTHEEIPTPPTGNHTDTFQIWGQTQESQFVLVGFTQTPHKSLGSQTSNPISWGSHRTPPSLNGWAYKDSRDSLMGFTQTPLTNQLSLHSYLKLSQRVHTSLSKYWADTCTDAHTLTWGSHRHPHPSMGSPRYLHFLIGDTPETTD